MNKKRATNYKVSSPQKQGDFNIKRNQKQLVVSYLIEIINALFWVIVGYAIAVLSGGAL